MKMKDKTTVKKEFDTVQTFRYIKDKISLEISTMNFDQIKEYLKSRSHKMQSQK